MENQNNATARQLTSFIERIERLAQDAAAIQEDMKEVYAEAKGLGFVPKIMREIIRLRKMGEDERAEFEGLLDVYKGAVGMLEGTPLGEFARKRLDRESQSEENGAADPDQADIEDLAPPKPAHTDTIDQAREKGAEAARQGKRVLDNPYPAGDPCRAAWDEGWCSEAGSDGMEIPKAFQRDPKPKKDEKQDD